MNMNVPDVYSRDDVEQEPQKTIDLRETPVHRGHPEINTIHNIEFKIHTMVLDTGFHLKLKAKRKIWLFVASFIYYGFLALSFFAFSVVAGYLFLRFALRFQITP